jgi:hypothetical protein
MSRENVLFSSKVHIVMIPKLYNIRDIQSIICNVVLLVDEIHAYVYPIMVDIPANTVDLGRFCPRFKLGRRHVARVWAAFGSITYG